MHLHHYLVEREWDERIQGEWMEYVFGITMKIYSVRGCSASDVHQKRNLVTQLQSTLKC